MIITETWMKPRNTDKIKEDMQQNKGLDLLFYNRPGKKNGGGVAIVFRPSKARITNYSFKREGFEMVAGRIKTKKNSRPVFVFAVYLPPNMTVGRSARAMELITEEMDKLKVDNADPIIYLGGDINNFPTDQITVAFPDINILQSPPTRGNARLDLCLSNVDQGRTKSFLLPPLESATTKSDHSALLFKVENQDRHVFKLVKYSTRIFKPKKEQEFVQAVN